MNKREAVMYALAQGHTLFRNAKGICRWKERGKGLPSVANPIISPLFQTNMIFTVLENVRLTESGRCYTASMWGGKKKKASKKAKKKEENLDSYFQKLAVKAPAPMKAPSHKKIYAEVPAKKKEPHTTAEKAIFISVKVKTTAEKAGRIGPGWGSYMRVTVEELLMQGYQITTPKGKVFKK